MSLLERIRECNATDLSGLRAFRVGTARVGWIAPDFAAQLRRFPKVLSVGETAVDLNSDLADFAARTAALAEVVDRLAAEGLIPGWRGEPYPATADFEAPALFTVERAAAIRFGLRTYGVHLMGYVPSEDGRAEGLRIWVAERSAEKQTGPGEKDAMVGGGVPYGQGPWQTLVKEAWEEAGLSAEWAKRARAVGDVRFLYRGALGYDQGLDYQYELALPAHIEPENQDGEVAGFALRPAAEVMAEIAQGPGYFYDANLAFIAFFLRHGLIPEDDPDRAAIERGLKGEV